MELSRRGLMVTRLMDLLSLADSEKQAVIQAASWTISSAGFTIGVAAASAVFLKLSLGKLEGTSGEQLEVLNNVRANFYAMNSLGGREKVEVVEVYLKGLRGVLYLVVGEMVVSALSSFCMENNVIDEENEGGSRAQEADKVSMES
jgi:hypothetical protein